MENKKEPMSVFISKLILTASFVVSFGALFVAMGYLLSRPQQTIAPIVNPVVNPVVNPASDERCDQKVKFSDVSKCPLSRIIYGYEFDLAIGKCKEVEVYGGCSFETPFNSLEECQKTCEEKIEIKTEIKSAIVGEDFLITLNANPSTGYSWTADFDEDYLTLRSKDFVSDRVSPEIVGAGGKEVFTFAPIKAGETTVTMNYGRSWESKPRETKVFKYNRLTAPQYKTL